MPEPIYSGPLGGLMGTDADYQAVSDLGERFGFDEKCGLEIIALIVQYREAMCLAQADARAMEVKVAELRRSAPPLHPTDQMLEAGVAIHNTQRGGPDETLVHDIWQSMYDAWSAWSASKQT
jgi:hypothetical protein